MDLKGTQISNTFGNLLTLGTVAGTPTDGVVQNGDGSNVTSLTLTGGTVTASNPLLDMTQTWNDASVTFTSLKLNVTNTASATGSILLDLQVGGSSRFKVNAAGGSLFESGGHIFESNANALLLTNSGETKSLVIRNDYTFIPNTAFFGWGNTGSFATDVRLYRDAAQTLAQRNSTNAQTFNIYNTYTDSSNYERGFLKWNSNVLEIGAEELGTGTLRGVKLGTAATSLIGFYDATAIVQPTTGIAEAAFVENIGGTAVNVDSTFGGYTIQQIAQALQNLGLLA